MKKTVSFLFMIGIGFQLNAQNNNALSFRVTGGAEIPINRKKTSAIDIQYSMGASGALRAGGEKK